MENTATTLTKKREVKKVLRTKKIYVEKSREEIRSMIEKSEKSGFKPFSFEEFDRKYLFPLEEAEKKKKALQGK